MKRPYLSFLHCFIALLACCTGLFAHAGTYQVPTPEGFEFATTGAVHYIYTDADNVKLFEWDTRFNPDEQITYIGIGFGGNPNLDKIQNVTIYVTTQKGDETVIDHKSILSFQPTETANSSWTSINPNDNNITYQPDQTYATSYSVVVTYTEASELEPDTYNFGPFSYTIKDATEQPNPPTTDPTGVFTYTITGNRCDFEVVLSNTDGHELQAINVWAEANQIPYFKQTSTSNPFKGSFTVTGLNPGETKEYYVKAEAIFNDCTIGGGNKNNMVGTDVAQTFTGVETSDDNLVKIINSEEYTDDTYKNGISYTKANFQKDNETLIWTFPDWAYDEQYTDDHRARGISGRYVKVEKSADQGWWAPTIPYTIGNDEYGYIHATLEIPGDVPVGFYPQFVVNNISLQNAEATRLTKEDDGKWHFKSAYPYPNNRTISYYFRASWANGGQLQTRSFGYKVENVTNEKSEPYSLTTLAEEEFGKGNVSGQIYLCHAHDTATDITDNELSDGYWNSIHRPCDYANLNTSNFRFCPAFWYIIANDANNPGKVFVAVQFVEDINTVIPSDFVPVFNIYDPAKLNVDQGQQATASLRAKTFLADDQIVEPAVPLSQVPGMVNTYKGTTTGTYDANKKIAVGMKFQYTSIIRGNGYSSTAPRYYVMSSDDSVVTGIEEVAEDEAVPALSTVYNLQGVAVRVNVATETALEGLPAGIYIVNGRKYAVR